MSEDPEVLPPEKKGVPAKRQEGGQALTRTHQPPMRANGVIGAAVTGFQVEMEARAHEKIAGNVRAQTDVLNAETARREAALKLLRTAHKLEEAPHILAIDRAERHDEREASLEKIEDQRAERAHQRKLDEIRRQREIEEAGARKVEAERQKFTAEQGYENQQRLKDRNLRIWEKQHEARELDAHVETEKVRSELQGSGGAEKQSSLDSMRAKAEQSLIEALADGNDAEAERWQRVLDALGEE